MRKILVLGAGQSTPFLIRYLLDHAATGEWNVVVGDRRPDVAADQVGGHERGAAIALDAGDPEAMRREVTGADCVVNLLPPPFQVPVATLCVDAGVSMVSASYRNRELLGLEDEARSKGLALLTELGLDPGIDLMSSMETIDQLREKGGRIDAFLSYGSGVPAPESIDNPLGYAVTWNPRNVVMSARKGAIFLRDGRTKVVPWHRIFAETWEVPVEGVGTMVAYPNRDSLAYRESYGLDEVRTLIRGTLRHPGFCETWRHIVALGLPDEDVEVPGLEEWTYRRLTGSFLPDAGPESTVEARTAAFLGLEPEGKEMARLAWLGLFAETPIGHRATTPARALIGLLSDRLTLPPGGRDMVVLLHEFEVSYPNEGGRRERIVSSLVEKGEPDGITAMARTVGLPAGTAARLLLDGSLNVTGCPLPTEKAIYQPMLRELDRDGIRFRETVTALD